MTNNTYGVFMNMKQIKKEFAQKSTATMMRLVHKEQIPYKKVSNKIILFPTDIVMKKLEMFRKAAERIYRS